MTPKTRTIVNFFSRAGLVLAASILAAACMSSSGSGSGDEQPGTAPDAHGSGGADSCGNHLCDQGETPSTCPEDCPRPVCGNKVCDSGETAASCPQDCTTCGNNVCETGETIASCPKDCTCGNNVCDPNETTSSCPQDCPQSVCGNAKCESGETETSCPADCTATLVTVNNSSYIVYSLHVYPCTDTDEGPDWLKGKLLYSGYRFTLDQIPPGCYLFHATTYDGSGWRRATGVTLTAGETFTWTLSN